MTRLLIAAVAALSLLAAPAAAQMGRHQRDAKAPPPKPKVDEKAYKAALDRIPNSKAKVDPWSNTR